MNTKARIGVDLNSRFTNGRTTKDVDNYLKELRKHRVTNLDLIVSFVIEDDNRHILESIYNNGMTVSMHSNAIDNIYTTFNNSGEIGVSVDKQLGDLQHTDKILREIGFSNDIPIVYHGGQVVDGDRKKALNLGAEFFNRLSEKTSSIGMSILMESLSVNHPKVDCIGNNWDDFQIMNNLILSNNWGICWDTGHTRSNSVEEGESPYPPANLVDKIKFTHIHNMYDNVDHLPLIDGEWQDNEIKFLVTNGYNGVYSLEYDYRFVDDFNHIEVVSLSTYRLSAIVEYFIKNKINIKLLETIQRSNLRIAKNEPITVVKGDNKYKEIDYQVSMDSIKFSRDIRDYSQIILSDGTRLPLSYLNSRDGMAIYRIVTSIQNTKEAVSLLDFIFGANLLTTPSNSF